MIGHVNGSIGSGCEAVRKFQQSAAHDGTCACGSVGVQRDLDQVTRCGGRGRKVLGDVERSMAKSATCYRVEARSPYIRIRKNCIREGWDNSVNLRLG